MPKMNWMISPDDLKSSAVPSMKDVYAWAKTESEKSNKIT